MIDVKEILMGMAPYVHFISFGLLMLSGFSFPISEDMVFIISASIAATVVPHNTYYIFAGCFLGAYLSDFVAYCIGRYGVNKIVYSRFMIRWKIVNPEKMHNKIDRMKEYFNRYGGKTLFFGRFIPFGMRNVIFMTCGLIKMKMVKFLAIDFCAVTCTSLILFSLGYSFGNNYNVIFPYLNRYKFAVLGIVISAVALVIIRNRFHKRPQDEACDKQHSAKAPKNVIIK